MNANCYYIKEPLKLQDNCDGKVAKYTIKVLTPAKGNGVCKFNLKDVKNGDIVEVPCSNDECNIDEYNSGNTSFKNAVLCLIKSFTDTFARDFPSGPGSCSSDKVIKQNFKLVVGPGADLGNCEVEVNQQIDATSVKVCANINETLNNFEGQARQDFITKLLDNDFDFDG
jgi:hypothetical protein